MVGLFRLAAGLGAVVKDVDFVLKPDTVKVASPLKVSDSPFSAVTTAPQPSEVYIR